MRIFENIDNSWVFTSLGKITSSILYGMNEKATSDRNGIPFIRITDINKNGKLNAVNSKYISSNTPNTTKYLLKKGDILIARSGSVGLSYLHKSNDVLTVFASYLIRFRLNQELVLPEYIHYYLHSPMFWNYVERVSRGATILNINSQQLSKLPIPLPTLSEQMEIVKILQQVESLKLLKTKAKDKTSKLPKSIFNQIFGIFSKVNFDTTIKLGTVADVVSGVTKGRNLGNRETVNVPYLRVANVQDGFLDLNTLKEIEVLPSDLEKYSLKKGDVVITEGGDYDKLGRGAIWDYNILNCIHQNHVFRIRLNREALSPIFFNYYLQSSFARQYFLRSAKRTTNLASINISQLKLLPVPIPSLELQQEFETLIRNINVNIDNQSKSEHNLDKLIQSIHIQAFIGKLTQPFRQKEQSVISSQAKLRDETLSMKSVIESKIQSDQTVEFLKNINSYISKEQKKLFDSFKKTIGYLLPEYDFNDLDLPPNQIQRNLDLLAEIGLIKSVNIAIAPGEIGNVFYTPAYRSLSEEDNTKEADLEHFEKESKI